MKRHLVVIAGVVAIGSLGLTACGDDDDDDSSSGSSGNATTYEISDIAYSDLSAPAGATVEVTNSSGAAHTFTADDSSFDDEISSSGKTEVKVPDEAGTYPFHCEIHSSMHATLTVT